MKKLCFQAFKTLKHFFSHFFFFNMGICLRSTRTYPRTRFCSSSSVRFWQGETNFPQVVGRTTVMASFVPRDPENLKLAGNWPKVAAMYGCQNHKKIYILVVFQLFIFFTMVLCIFFVILNQFSWQYIFQVAQFG